MAKISCYRKSAGKSAGCGFVDHGGKSFLITRAVMGDGDFSLTAWDDRPDEGTVKLDAGIYVSGNGEEIRAYRTKAGTGTSIVPGIGGVLGPGRYRWKSEHKRRDDAGAPAAAAEFADATPEAAAAGPGADVVAVDNIPF